MSLQKKNPCYYHDPNGLGSLHPLYVQYPTACPWCKGTLEWDGDVYFESWDGPTKNVDWDEINNYQSDLFIAFDCICGDNIVFSDTMAKACSCGRVYVFESSLRVDESHIGDTQHLIDKSNVK